MRNRLATAGGLAIVSAGVFLLAGCTSVVSGKPSDSRDRPSPSVGEGTSRISGPTGFAPLPSASIAPKSTVPASTPAPASSTPSTGARFAGFVGSWYGHGRSLTVRADGTVSIVFRTYVNCTAQLTTGCDRISGNTITDGGLVTGHIVTVTNATTVRVQVTETSVPDVFQLGPFTLGHDLAHHALAAFVGDFQNAPFCGPGATSDYCGA